MTAIQEKQSQKLTERIYTKKEMEDINKKLIEKYTKQGANFVRTK